MSLAAEKRNKIPYIRKAVGVFFRTSFTIVTTAGRSVRAQPNLYARRERFLFLPEGCPNRLYTNSMSIYFMLYGSGCSHEQIDSDFKSLVQMPANISCGYPTAGLMKSLLV